LLFFNYYYQINEIQEGDKSEEVIEGVDSYKVLRILGQYTSK